jgi:6-phosphogluconolactonase
MTLTFPGIARAAHAVFTVEGDDKRDALRRVLAGDDLPAARVSAARVTWLVSRELAAP